jgi:hypothetical protein
MFIECIVISVFVTLFIGFNVWIHYNDIHNPKAMQYYTV